MEGHHVKFGRRYVMRMVWVGVVDGPELEKMLIEECWEKYGKLKRRDLEKKGGPRCINKNTGGGGLTSSELLIIYVYLLHKDKSKMEMFG
jgi:hypothetical protein